MIRFIHRKFLNEFFPAFLSSPIPCRRRASSRRKARLPTKGGPCVVLLPAALAAVLTAQAGWYHGSLIEPPGDWRLGLVGPDIARALLRVVRSLVAPLVGR